MSVRQALAPRDPEGAARALFALATTLAVAVLLAALITPAADRPPLGLLVPALLAVVAAARLLRRVPDPTRIWWSAVPFVAVGLVVLLDLAWREPAAPSEIFLVFPAVYASRQLTQRSAFAIIGLSAVVLLLLLLHGLDPRPALVRACYEDAVLVSVMVRLTLTGRRFDQRLSAAEAKAAVDPLTGLGTRTTLERAGARLLGHAGGSLTLVLIDLDEFKAVNDTHGHPAGDAVLVRVAAVIRECCRESDVMSRLGGDEFAVLLVGVPPRTAIRRAEEIRATVAARPVRPDDGSGPVPVTVSVGLAHADPATDSFVTLYSAADRALYAAKRAGRDQVVESAAGRG